MSREEGSRNQRRLKRKGMGLRFFKVREQKRDMVVIGSGLREDKG